MSDRLERAERLEAAIGDPHEHECCETCSAEYAAAKALGWAVGEIRRLRAALAELEVGCE